MDVPLYADIQKSFKIVQLHTPHLPSKIQISFGLSGKCSANRAGLKSDEINCCFLGEVVVLGLVALLFFFFLKGSLEGSWGEFLTSLKIFLPFLCLQRASCSPKAKRASCHLEQGIVCLVCTKWSQS